MIDGTVARKTGTANEFGSKFDSTADFIFVAVCLIKLTPLLTNDELLQNWELATKKMDLRNIAPLV